MERLEAAVLASIALATSVGLSAVSLPPRAPAALNPGQQYVQAVKAVSGHTVTLESGLAECEDMHGHGMISGAKQFGASLSQASEWMARHNGKKLDVDDAKTAEARRFLCP